MATRCQASNQAGKPCGAEPYRDGWCRWHHPSLAEQRREWSAKGGRRKSNRERARRDLPPAMEPNELEQVLSGVLRGVIGGRIAPNVGNACAALARTLVGIREATEIERRLADLEAAAAAAEPPTRSPWRA